MPGALYERAGDVLVPQPITQGPWSPDAQHGGPVAGLLAGIVEQVPSEAPMQVVRLTVELLRPVPLRPLVATTAVVRPGRRVQLVDARLAHDGTDVAWARALRVRELPLQVPEPTATDVPPVPPAPPAEAWFRVPYAEAVDLRFVEGSWDTPGPVRMWSRLLVPVIAGEASSPLQRAAAVADFGNGVSWVLDFDTHVFINPDLTVSLSRVPEGEWLGFDVATRQSTLGYGQAESAIFDRRGTVGRATQSLLVDRR